MKVNLTKILEVQNYTGTLGATSWVGVLSPTTTIETVYAFELAK